uniref:Uncharacterized protein n=1 Tax=Glossina brevipalpis TaxID=37001 RepID=A0A1A9X5J8_9MUSC
MKWITATTTTATTTTATTTTSAFTGTTTTATTTISATIISSATTTSSAIIGTTPINCDLILYLASNYRNCIELWLNASLMCILMTVFPKLSIRKQVTNRLIVGLQRKVIFNEIIETLCLRKYDLFCAYETFYISLEYNLNSDFNRFCLVLLINYNATACTA